MVQGQTKGFAKDKIELDGIVFLRCLEKIVLQDALEKALNHVQDGRLLHNHANGIRAQQVVVFLHGRLEIFLGARPNGDKIAQHLLRRFGIHGRILDNGVFERLRTNGAAHKGPHKALQVNEKAQDFFILKKLSVLGPELFEDRRRHNLVSIFL